MWSFTVRGLFVQNLSGIDYLFESKETDEEKQQENVTARDTFIGV